MSIYTRYGDNEVVSNESVGEVTIDPIRQLYIACESISTEAAEMGNISGWFARQGANMSMAIKRGFELITTLNWAPLTTLYPSNMQTVMRTRDYMELQNQTFPQPRGFSGNLLNYITDMAPRIVLATALKQNVIDPAIQRLGYFVTNASERNERRSFPGGAADVGQLASLLADEAKYFKGGADATAAFGDLFSNNGEFIQAEYKMVEYGKLLAKGSPETVKAAVQQLVAVAEGLFKSLATDSDPTSKELIQTVGNELAGVAKWVEWYAVQITHLTETNACLSQMEKQLR